MKDDAHRRIKTRHYNAMWRVLRDKRVFVYSWSQAFWLRRMVGEGFVRFFQGLKDLDITNPKGSVSLGASNCDCYLGHGCGAHGRSNRRAGA